MIKWTEYLTQIVEELEDRLGNQMEDLLAVVAKSLHDERATQPSKRTTAVLEDKGTHNEVTVEVYEGEQDAWRYDANEMEFDDMGEGAGVEGDLDVEDD